MIERNILYEIKKEANKKADPYFAPNSQDDDIREQNKKLRTQLRAKDTEIFRLNSKIQELTAQVRNSMLATRNSSMENQTKEMVSTLSSVPMVFQNKQLKEANENLHQDNLELNGKNNELEARLRQLESDNYQLELRVKELGILQKLREDRFKDELDRLTPVIVQEPSEFTKIKDSVEKLTEFLRLRVVEVVENIFMISARECEGKKKMNSFNIFRNYWLEIKGMKANGYAAAVSSFKAMFRVMKLINQDYGQYREEEEFFKGTINEWVIESLIEIKNTPYKEAERKLFRLLGIQYRCKFPIKGQKHELTETVKAHLESSIAWEVLRLLFLKDETK